LRDNVKKGPIDVYVCVCVCVHIHVFTLACLRECVYVCIYSVELEYNWSIYFTKPFELPAVHAHIFRWSGGYSKLPNACGHFMRKNNNLVMKIQQIASKQPSKHLKIFQKGYLQNLLYLKNNDICLVARYLLNYLFQCKSIVI